MHRRIPGSLAPVLTQCPGNTAECTVVYSVFSDLSQPSAKTNPFFCFSGFPDGLFLDVQTVFCPKPGEVRDEYGFPQQTLEQV